MKPAATNVHLAFFPVSFKRTAGGLVAILADGHEILAGPDPFRALNCLAMEWRDNRAIEVNIPCTCGARSVGAPDFAPGHAAYCNHSPRFV